MTIAMAKTLRDLLHHVWERVPWNWLSSLAFLNSMEIAGQSVCMEERALDLTSVVESTGPPLPLRLRWPGPEALRWVH